MREVTIIGITGTNGAGKDEVATYLVQKGFTHYSVRKYLVDELGRRGVSPIDRIAMIRLGTDLRGERGPEYFVSLFMAQAEKSNVSKIVIDSIRNPFEAQALKDAGGILISVDADPWVRYQRVMVRDYAMEKIPFPVFRLQEDREMVSCNPTDPAQIAVRKVMNGADFHIDNSSNLSGLLDASVDTILSQYGVLV